MPGGQQGEFEATENGPQRLADTATPIPEGSGNFASFGPVAVSETDVAFLGGDSAGRAGIYDTSGSGLVKVVAVGDKIGAKMISGLNFSRSGLYGDLITFQASFTDGSEGIFTVSATPPADFRVTLVEKLGNDLRLTFNSRSGKTYIIQALDAFGPQTWLDNPSTTMVGTGGPIQITLPNAFSSTQKFFRAAEVP